MNEESRPKAAPQQISSLDEANTSVLRGCDTLGYAEMLADLAISEGAPVIGIRDGYELWVIPDLFEAEAVANGKTFPPSTRMRRDDGRSVVFYRCPIGGDQ